MRVGFPEEIGESGNRGMREFARMVSEEGLTSTGFDGRAHPALAESWTWEADDMRLRVRLRRGVVLHDGRPFKGDLAATIVRTTIADTNNLMQYPSLSDVRSVSANGDLELVFELSRRSALLPEDLAVPLNSGGGTTGIGPYRLVNQTSSSAELERFEDYYLGPPSIERIIVQPSGGLRTSWTSLLRGDVDMVTDVPADAVQFIRNEDVQVPVYARWYQFAILLNSRRSTFRHPAVKRALNIAIDRNEVIAQSLQGRGVPSSGPIWPEYWAYDRTVPAYAYDPPLASALLDGAGYVEWRAYSDTTRPPARLRFTCLVAEDFSVQERIALVVQKQLFGIGVDMEIEVVPGDEIASRAQSGDFDAILLDMISGPTPGRAYIFWASAASFKGSNLFGYENAEAERLFTIIRTTLNEAAVRSATARLQRTLLEDPPALFLAWNERARGIRRNIVIPEGDGDPMSSIAQWEVRDGNRLAATP